MKNRFKKTLIGTLLLALTATYAGMLTPISATSTDYSSVLEGASIYNGHSYKLFDVAMTWHDAKDYCESQGGHLVTITSKDEQQFVSTMASYSSKKNIWLGATKNSDGKYSWSNGETATFSNWGTGEPSNYNNSEDCVMMYTYSNGTVNLGEWNDVASTGGTVEGFTLDDIGFICEWDFTVDSSTSQTTTTITDITNYKFDDNGNIVTDENGLPVVTNQQGYVIDNEQLTTTSDASTDTTTTTELTISVITPATMVTTTADTIGSSEIVTTIKDKDNANMKYLYNGHTYQIFENMNLSWSNAKAYCTALGGHLVTITDENEQAFINAIINDNPKPNLWIGLERNLDSTYSWVTGEEFSYNNWINNEEVNYPTDLDIAVLVQTYDTSEDMPCGTWTDISKEGGVASGYSIQEIGFICEWDEELEGAYQLADMGIDIDLPNNTTPAEDTSNPTIIYIVIGGLVVAVLIFIVATSLPKKEEK